MHIELWGVRGSISAPLQNTELTQKLTAAITQYNSVSHTPDEIQAFLKKLPTSIASQYGGNTTCLSVTSKAGNTYIIDCGTGLRLLGNQLMGTAAGTGKGRLKFFITHTHWDHIQGIPFFKPIYIPGNTLDFYSPYKDLNERLAYQQDNRFFPKTLDEMPAVKRFHLLRPGESLLFDDGVEVSCFPLKHPGGSFAYRFVENGKTFIFATDAEFTGTHFDHPFKGEDEFFSNADILIIDSQYTLNESFTKFEWGHTSSTMAVNCGIRWKVKQLGLTHHEPMYPDEMLDTILHDAIVHRNMLKCDSMNIFIAQEGMTIDL